MCSYITGQNNNFTQPSPNCTIIIFPQKKINLNFCQICLFYQHRLNVIIILVSCKDIIIMLGGGGTLWLSILQTDFIYIIYNYGKYQVFHVLKKTKNFLPSFKQVWNKAGHIVMHDACQSVKFISPHCYGVTPPPFYFAFDWNYQFFNHACDSKIIFLFCLEMFVFLLKLLL